jgi:hypothetical protein
MADDNSIPNRSNDPLAELARLIGQSDPFVEQSRAASPADTGAVAPIPPAPSYGNMEPPQYGSDPAPAYSDPAPQYSEPAPSYSEPQRYSEPAQPYSEPQRYSEPAAPQQYGLDYGRAPAPRYAADYPPRYADDRAAANNWPAAPAQPASYPPAEPFPLPPQHSAQPAPHYDHQGYARNYGGPSFADPHGRPHADTYPPERSGGVDALGYPAATDRPVYPSPLYPHEPEAGSMPPPHADEFYDDEPRSGRRKGLLTVAAVLGLAVIGTAGAFGYRSLFGGAGSSGPPPVIRASGEPSKVAPPPAMPDTSASKFSYDRFGDAGKDEQVVRREEKPVDLGKAAPAPRTVFPAAPAPNSAKPPGTTAAANPPSAIGEPRRVRTVPIRPDQGNETTPGQQPVSVAPPRQANAAANAAASNGSTPVADNSPRAASPRPSSSRVAARSEPAPVANAPLSLAPDANNSLPAPSAQENVPQNVPPPPRASAAPARVASAPATGSGSYLVQVSSQRSEADAQSAYRSIQSKYPGVLGSHPHTVRRADLGSKGVYYRAMVGPFPSREAAVQLCSSLKQAGGDCVVQH